MDESVISDRENVMKFLRQLSESGFDAVFVVGRKGNQVDALWYGDHMVINTMAELGKNAIWDNITGKLETEEHEIEEEKPTDWDINSI